jgi:hypothetical protein
MTRMGKWTGRASTLTVLAAAGTLVFAGVAVADDISNGLDSSIDSAAEAMPLNVGGADGVTVLSVTPRNGDGKNGCNLTSSSILGLSVTSSNAGVATVSPSSVTFTSCSDTKTLTVTPLAQGTATISATQTTNTTGGTFNLAPATFTVTVAPPLNTAPGITVTGVSGGVSYDKGAVPAASCEVTDVEDGNSTFAATLSVITGAYASDGIGAQTASCSYTDGGGLTAAASETYSIIDPSAPVISSALSPATPDGSNGWYRSDVALTWTVSEPQSPNSVQMTGCVDQAITADQADTAYTCAATSAGGPAAEQAISVKRDATAPTLTLVGGPSGDHYFGTVPSAPTCVAADALSGLAGACVVSGGGSTVGTHEYTATATDNAGNTTTASQPYRVLPWTAKGFSAPVDMGGVWNSVKGGSTVPLKFEVFAGATELTSTSVVTGFTAKTVACPGSTAVVDEIELVTTGGTNLRYDTTGGQFIQNWQTPKKPGTCVQAIATLQDGSAITANFTLK